MTYNSLRLDALNSEDARKVQEFSLNGKILQNRVNHAYNQWVSKGYKHEYEQMTAFIDQVTRRNLLKYKQSLLMDLKNAKISSITSGGNFYFSTLYPQGVCAQSIVMDEILFYEQGN